MAELVLHPGDSPLHKTYKLPLSKSVSNRLLILDYLYDLGLDSTALSQAADTRLLQSVLLHPLPTHIDARDAGTVIRFVTAVAATIAQSTTLTGTERMQHRPIGPLVQSLRGAGASIDHTGEDGYPPLRVERAQLQSGAWQVDATQSSQYVSALMMIMPSMDAATTLELLGTPASMPYILMTLRLMEWVGLDIAMDGYLITCSPAPDRLVHDTIICPSDYSALAFPILELSTVGGSIQISQLSPPDSLQGDEAVLDFCTLLGIEYRWEDGDLFLEKKNQNIVQTDLPIFDFGDIPDLALPMVSALCVQHDELRIRGVQTLDLKESERWEILQDIVYTLGCKVFAEGDHYLIRRVQERFGVLDIDDHSDHRVVMSLASLSHLYESTKIYHPEAVSKSFPDYWTYFDA